MWYKAKSLKLLLYFHAGNETVIIVGNDITINWSVEQVNSNIFSQDQAQVPVTDRQIQSQFSLK